MKNLLPDFILENYKNNVFEGDMKAFTMFTDISGFTPMTEKLLKRGKEGAETLSDILTSIFKPTVKCVYNSGGFITNFAGDSFTSIIPIDDNSESHTIHAINAIHCANNILNEFKNRSSFRTGFGNIPLNVRIGMSVGNVEWAIVGKDKKSFYFRGDAITSCADAQKLTANNEILFHQKIYDLMKGNGLSFSRKGKFYCLNNLPDKSVLDCLHKSESNSTLTRQIFSKHFFPDSVLNAKDTGEFRDVASVFISFDQTLPGSKINELFKVIIESVSHYSGYLKDIEFGDKGGVIVCYFGAPVSFEEDVQRTITFVQFIKNRIDLEESLRELKLRIGITFGRVYTGFIGSDERVQYTVLGNVVNLCARLMSGADWGEIWMSEDAYRRLKDKSSFLPIGSHPFKGFRNEIPVYKYSEKHSSNVFKKESNNVSRTDLKHRYAGNMIGRRDETEKLKAFTEEIFDNNTSGIIYLTGEAGIGKSRLIKEFRRDYSSTNKVSWMYSYATEILNRPLSPFKYLLKNFFKQSSLNTPEENKRVFENITDIIFRRLDNLSIENKELSAKYIQVRNELIRTKSILGAILDIYWTNSLYEQLEPELRSENTLFAICNFVIAECMIQPVVMEIEDVHWMDNDSWEVLKMLLNNITDLPLTIICTTRHPLHRKKQLTDINKKRYDIQLDYFGKGDIKLFAQEILKGDIDEESAEYILRNTNGNPYFIEQLVLDLNEKDIWKKRKNIFSLTEFDDENLPSTINSVLVSRFDRLPGNVKNVVQTASVLGREFDMKVLKQMFPADGELESKLLSAERENIWYSGDEGKYVFTHALLCKAVHDMQLESEVNELHLLAATSVKKLSGKKISHHNSEQIAYHLGLGYNIVNSKHKLTLSKAKLKNSEFRNIVKEYITLQTTIADKYKTDYRNERALELYDLILSVSQKLDDKEQIYKILLKKVEILNNISRWDEAGKMVEEAIKIAREMKDEYKEMVGKKWLAEVYFYKNELDKSYILIKNTLKYFRKNRVSSEVIDSIYSLGHLSFFRGRYDKAWDYYYMHYQLTRKSDNKFQSADSISSLATILTKKGDSVKAIIYASKALKISKNIQYKHQIAMCNRIIGNNYFYQGFLVKSFAAFDISLKTFESIGNRSQIALTLGNIGNTHFINSSLDKAKICYERQLDIFKSINNLSGIATSLGSLGMIYASNGDYHKALDSYKKQYRINRRLKKEASIAVSFGNIGKLYFDKGKYALSVNYFIKQFKIASKISKTDEMFSSLINLGTSQSLMNNFSKAKFYYDKATSLNKNRIMNLDNFNLHYNYAELLIKMKDYRKAIKLCNNILKMKKFFNDIDSVNSAKILKNKTIILNHLNGLSRKKSYSIKMIKDKCQKLVRNIEDLSKELTNEEYIADSYYELSEISNIAGKHDIRISGEKEYRDKAILLHKNILLRKPKHIYKRQLYAILKNEFI